MAGILPLSLQIPPRIAGFDLASFQRSRSYDMLMRLPFLAWTVYFGARAASNLAKYEREADPMMPDALYAVNIAMQLAVVAFFATLASMVVMRRRPSERARGIEPRISALLGTFLVPIVVLFPRRELSLTEGIISTVMVLGGSVMAIYVLTHLGRSFSIMAEARGLVTSGLYRYVRHPLYLVEEIAVIGSVLQYLSVWTAVLLAVQIAFQLRRMHNEEIVLMGTFPEYAAYKANTARLIPGVY
jgi:protein-S-isoprenylcysteine O-methyltransferase Ste14